MSNIRGGIMAGGAAFMVFGRPILWILFCYFNWTRYDYESQISSGAGSLLDNEGLKRENRAAIGTCGSYCLGFILVLVGFIVIVTGSNHWMSKKIEKR